MTTDVEQSLIGGREPGPSNAKPITGIVAIAVIAAAVAIWVFAGLWNADPMAPLPECSPPRNQNITI